MNPIESLGDAKALLDQRGVIGACLVATTVLVQGLYSLPTWKSWERPDLLAGLLVVSFCTAHGFYEALLGQLQRRLLDQTMLANLRRRLPASEIDHVKTVDEARRFREGLFAYAPLRVQHRIETHENARRNSLYLATSSLGSVVLSGVLAFVDPRISLLPLRVYAVLVALTVLCMHAARYRSRVLGRDLGHAYSADVTRARSCLSQSPRPE